MIGTCAIAAAMAIVGAAIGALAVISLGIRRQERAASLADDIPSRAVCAARRLNGLYTRGPWLTRQTGDQRALTCARVGKEAPR